MARQVATGTYFALLFDLSRWVLLVVGSPEHGDSTYALSIYLVATTLFRRGADEVSLGFPVPPIAIGCDRGAHASTSFICVTTVGHATRISGLGADRRVLGQF
jgi:hypothetical protein